MNRENKKERKGRKEKRYREGKKEGVESMFLERSEFEKKRQRVYEKFR